MTKTVIVRRFPQFPKLPPEHEQLLGRLRVLRGQLNGPLPLVKRLMLGDEYRAGYRTLTSLYGARDTIEHVGRCARLERSPGLLLRRSAPPLPVPSAAQSGR